MYYLLEYLNSETLAIGIDVVTGLNERKPVICLCVSEGVFAVDSSIVKPSDFEILFTYLRGLRKSTLVSLKELQFSETFSFLGNFEFPSVFVVQKPVKLRSPPASSTIKDPAALAVYFGLACSTARAAHVSPFQPPVKPDGTSQKILSHKREYAQEPVAQQALKRQRKPVAAEPQPVVTKHEDPPPLFIVEAQGGAPMQDNTAEYLRWFTR
jgi:hypothetical protein